MGHVILMGSGEPPRPQAGILSDGRKIRNLRDLYDITGVKNLDDLAGCLIDWSESDDYVRVTGIGPFASEGIAVALENVITEYRYPFEFGDPFRAGDLLSDLIAIDRERGAELGYQELAEQIEDVEGIEVSVSISYDYDPGKLKRQHHRLFINEYLQVQYPRPYPYKRPMGGSKTAKEWLTDRFERHYPGLGASLANPLPMETTLGALRSPSWVPLHERAPSLLKAGKRRNP